MEEVMNTGAEVQEVAEPATVTEATGAEEQVPAEPVESSEAPSSKTDADAAFAELRRQLAAEKEANAKLTSANQEYEQALSHWFPDAENKAVAAEAHYMGQSYDDVMRERNERIQAANLAQENKRLTDEINSIKVERAIAQGLRDVQEIDPSVKDLTELGDSFAKYIASGLSSKQAYFAVKAEQEATRVVAPKPPGKVNQSAAAPKDFYTFDEVQKMSSQERYDKADIIRESMAKW